MRIFDERPCAFCGKAVTVDVEDTEGQLVVCEDCSSRLGIKVWVVVEMFGGMVDSLFVYDNEEAARGHWQAWWKDRGIDPEDEDQIAMYRQAAKDDAEIHEAEVRLGTGKSGKIPKRSKKQRGGEEA